MASEGPNNVGTAVNDSSYGLYTWYAATLSNGASSNDSYITTESLVGATQNTYYLKCTNFGFTVPTGATIDGVVVEVERNSAYGGTVRDDRVRIVKGGTIGNTDKASGADWPSSDAYATYGGASDLWGETWAASDINSSTFGVAIAALSPSGAPFGFPQIDHVRITVHYTEGGGGGGSFSPRRQQRRFFRRRG